MENSNKPSSSNVDQSPDKKNLAKKSTKKMSPMKSQSAMMQNSKKSPTSESLKKKSPFKVPVKAAKKQAATLKKSNSSSEGLMKTRAASNRASLDSLMAGFQTEGKAKTALGMPLKVFSESAVSLLLSNYKVENEKVLRTTALAM